MQDHAFKKSMTGLSVSFLLATALALLAACSDNSGTAASATPTPTPTPTAGVIALGTSTNAILTDNATAATLTATLVDSSNAAMAGVAVSFSTTTGILSASTATTDANGQAIVTLKSGLSDYSNRTATVTASVAGQSASVPVLIKGSTLALALASNTTQVGAGTITATATATDAAGLGKSNQTIRFSIGAASTGAGTLSTATMPTAGTCNTTPTASACTLVTDPNSIVTPTLTFTPTVAGTVVLTAEWLNSAGAVTVTTTQNIIVTATTGVAFAIMLPTANPAALSSGTTQALAVTVPTNVGNEDTNGNGILNTEDTNGNGILDAGEDTNGNGILDTEDTNGNGVLDFGLVTDVRISATSGTWTGLTPAAAGTSIVQTPASMVCPTTVSSNCITATYTAPANSGSVTVQVDALGTVGGVPLQTLASLTRTFVISAPATAAAQVLLNASSSTIAPSSGSNISTLTLEATVVNLNYSSVGGAAVMFGLLGTTGSGETVSPAVVYTDSFGKATTTFSAGTSPTLAAIYAQASIVGQTCSGAPQINPPVAEINKLCDTTPLRVSSSAVSVTVGFGTAIEDTANTSQYKLPGSVLVVDSNGSAVAGATVTLTVFPARYRNGSIYPVWKQVGNTIIYICGGPFVSSLGPILYPIPFGPKTDWTDNEDINRNGILDDGTLAPAEDTTALGLTASQIAALADTGPLGLGNGVISPGHAAGGSVPMTVTTDSNGAATFYLQYPKSSAWFIEDEVTARVIVSGTESTAKINYILPMSVADLNDSNCIIGRTASY